MLRKIGKGIKKFMKDILSNDKNKLTIGLIMIGAGLGLVISVYLKVPA